MNFGSVPSRKRRIWIPLATILLLVIAFMAVVVYKALQPRYQFLRGLTPVFRGDPMVWMPMPASPSVGATIIVPEYQAEVYSFRGSFEEWQGRIGKEMIGVGAKLEPSTEDILKSNWDKLPVAQRKAIQESLKTMPKTAVWELPRDESIDPRRIQMTNVQLVKDLKFERGEPLKGMMFDGLARDPGWVTIILFEAKRPTFFSNINDAIKSAFNRP